MRIPDYYCPHCGRFKNRSEVIKVNKKGLMVNINYIECRHCGCTEVMKTKDEFEKFMDHMELDCNEECERKGE